MGKEPLRRRERREAHYLVRHEGMAARKPLAPEAVRLLIRGIDKHNANSFGVRSCVTMELDALYVPPSHAWCGEQCWMPWPAVGTKTTFISYAAWRRRDIAVKQLLIGGADPSVTDLAPAGCGPPHMIKLLRNVAPRSAVFAVAQLARLRSLANQEVYLWQRRQAGDSEPGREGCRGEGDAGPELAAATEGGGEEDAATETIVSGPPLPPPREPPASCDACGADRRRAPWEEPAPSDEAQDADADAPSPGYLFRCAPCGCACCERCLWRVFCSPPEADLEERGSLRCAKCRVTLYAPGLPDEQQMLAEARARGGELSGEGRRGIEAAHGERARPQEEGLAAANEALAGVGGEGGDAPDGQGSDRGGLSAGEPNGTGGGESEGAQLGGVGVEGARGDESGGANTRAVGAGADDASACGTPPATASAPAEGPGAVGLDGAVERVHVERVSVFRRWRCAWCLYDNFDGRERCFTCNLNRLSQMSGRRAETFAALPPLAAACDYAARLDAAQRVEALHRGAARSDTALLSALQAFGVSLDAPDEYGFSPLHLAAWHGAAPAIRRLRALGADPRPPHAHGGGTPATAAAANGHFDAVAALRSIGAEMPDGDRDSSVSSVGAALAAATLEAPPAAATEAAVRAVAATEVAARTAVKGVVEMEAAETEVAARAAPVSGARTSCLIPRGVEHPGAGSVLLDCAFPERLLASLETLFRSLPLAPRSKCTQGLNDRAYYCDAEGWVRKMLADGVRAAAAEAGGDGPVEGVAMPHMRFLLYAEAGGGLPPHLDLSRTDAKGRTSTHTFILYLTPCTLGGETVLLERLNGGERAKITPARGRLLLFPHQCPHLARPVVAEGLPKLLLRGEMY